MPILGISRKIRPTPVFGQKRLRENGTYQDPFGGEGGAGRLKQGGVFAEKSECDELGENHPFSDTPGNGVSAPGLGILGPGMGGFDLRLRVLAKINISA